MALGCTLLATQISNAVLTPSASKKNAYLVLGQVMALSVYLNGESKVCPWNK